MPSVHASAQRDESSPNSAAGLVLTVALTLLPVRRTPAYRIIHGVISPTSGWSRHPKTLPCGDLETGKASEKVQYFRFRWKAVETTPLGESLF
jgi:hypothetical protein